MGDGIDDPGPDFSNAGPVEYETSSDSANLALETAEAQLLSTPGVVSVGLGQGPAGTSVLVVGVSDAGVARQLPDEVEGVPVIVTVIGEVDALRDR